MYQASNTRYDDMEYNRVGNSGLKLPAISLGLWHNFGEIDPLATQRAILRAAFDGGITHFDMANNYGVPSGSAEENFGRIFAKDFKPYRDEMILSSKAGYTMWAGPYGDWGSRKSIIASCDQSLRRTGLDYFDIFYSHREDLETNVEETAQALDTLVRQGKALYIGISKYSVPQAKAIMAIFKELKTPFIIYQPPYNLLNRDELEGELQGLLEKEKIGAIAFSPLAQGILTDRYVEGIPTDSRASRSHFLPEDRVKKYSEQVKQLAEIAKARGQSLAQMALSWVLSNPVITSVLVGASSVEQLEANKEAWKKKVFSPEERQAIEAITA